MIVYHGSTQVVSQPLVNAGRHNLDFGPGFYVTDFRDQAIYWATRPVNNGQPHWLNVYELNLDAIYSGDCRCLRFEAYNFEWLEFVVANRRGEERWKQYDMIEGGIANDRVFNTIELYAAGLTPREDALAKLRYEKPNNQICLLRQFIIDHYLHFVRAEEAVITDIRKETQP